MSVLHLIIFVVGLGVAFFSAAWAGSTSGLPQTSIWPEIITGNPDPNRVPVVVQWDWGYVALVVVSVILLTGASRWKVGWFNIGQILGAMWIGLWTASWAFLLYAFQFPGGDDVEPCARENCWPAGIQETLMAAPLLLTSLAMVVVACFAHRLNWIMRALIPASTFLVLRVTQVLIWKPIVMPYLAGQ